MVIITYKYIKALYEWRHSIGVLRPFWLLESRMPWARKTVLKPLRYK